MINRVRHPVSLATVVVGLLVTVSLAHAQTADPVELDQVIAEIRRSSLEPARAVAVRNLEIDLDAGLLTLEEGLLIPATSIAGRTLEMVFDGRARLVMDPPDAIEAGQLKLFTGRENLDVEIEQAVLVLGNQAVANALLSGRDSATPAPDVEQRARDLYQEWIAGAERRGHGAEGTASPTVLAAEGALFRILVGDAPAQGMLALWCRSADLGDFHLVIDPFKAEQVLVGQFIASELDDVERHQVERGIRKAKRRGRLSQFRVADLGDWNTWISTPLRNSAGEARPGASGFEPEHYVLDAEISKQDERLSGTAKVTLRCELDGVRVATLHLFQDLHVRAVRDADGRALEWFRAVEDIHVVLAETMSAGERVVLEIEYDGVVLVELAKGIFSSLDTFSWFPRAGAVDRATYEATLRWPKKHRLFFSGRLVEEGEADGMRWQKRVLDVPSLGFSFEYGDFDVRTGRAGHVDLTVAFSKVPSNWDSGVKDEVLETLGDALLYFEQVYGPYPLDYLTVVTVPRGFSQGYLGFLTLAHSLVATPSGSYWVVVQEDYDRMRRESRTETVSHELSHQWWGNMVGWHSYRDQWLSEALADFSANAFTAKQAESTAVYLARQKSRWRNSLGAETKDGRTLESLGPVVLGQRLLSAFSDQAYSAVVYDKGAVVFRMLAQRMGSGPFMGMLGSLAQAVNGRTIDTPTFIKAIEHMSAIDLADFAEQFIYGTGVPEVYYDYKFTPDPDGGWRIEGKARQLADQRYRYMLSRNETGQWRVARERIPSVDIADYFLVVPFQVSLRDGKGSGEQTEIGLGGNLLLQGETTNFSIPVDREPRHFWFDQRGEVLAKFYSKNYMPKVILRYQATEMAGADAEATLKLALKARYLSEEALQEREIKEKDLERWARLQDASIYLDLVRLYLDENRLDDAVEAYEQAMERITRWDRYYRRGTRLVLESRFDLLEGDARSAYSELSDYLYLKLPRKTEDTVFDAARRKKFQKGRSFSGEAYALLAVAAYETEHQVIAMAALDEAEERGADMSALRSIMGEVE